MRQAHYDLVILGSGSTAFAAALRAQELGKTSVMTEERITGGTCVNRGCLPSKNLIEAAKRATLKPPGLPAAFSSALREGVVTRVQVPPVARMTVRDRDRCFGRSRCRDRIPPRIAAPSGALDRVSSHRRVAQKGEIFVSDTNGALR
jgi:hypothetical protein